MRRDQPVLLRFMGRFREGRDRVLERKEKDLPGRGVNALVGTDSEFEERTCPVCATLAHSDADYFARAFGDSRRFAATRDAVTDTLGFCARHGATLLSQERLTRGIVHVFRDAIPRVIPLLAEEYMHEDRVQQVFFGASSACPACAHGDRAAARHIGRLARQFSGARNQAERRRLDSLCSRHFQILAGALKPEIRVVAFNQYLGTLDQAARITGKLLRSRRAPDVSVFEDGAATLRSALELIAGGCAREPSPDGDALAEALRRCPTLTEAMAHPDVCPVCVEVSRAGRRWIHDLPLAAEFKQIGWLFFPTCPEHLWTVVRLGDSKLAATVITHALQVAIDHIQQQIQALVRAAEIEEERAREAAATARSGTRPKRKTEIQTPITVRATQCPACERLAIAEDCATGSLLELLQQRKHRNAFDRGYGLCMKHFAQIYPMAPKGSLRTTLAAGQRGRLAAFRLMLDERVQAGAENETQVLGDPQWGTALHRFCGFA